MVKAAVDRVSGGGGASFSRMSGLLLAAAVWAMVAGQLLAQTVDDDGPGLQLNFFGARGPDGAAQQGRGLILNIGAPVQAMAPAGPRYSVFFDGYSNALDREGQATVQQAAQRALALKASKIEVLADPDGTAVQQDNEAFIRATAVRQALLRDRSISGIPVEIVSTPGIAPMDASRQGALLRENQRIEIRFKTQ